MTTGAKESIPTTPLTEEELAKAKRYPQHRRPSKRGECAQVPRPCPFVGCQYHLYLDETKTGRLVLNFPHTDVLDLQHSCVLDIIDAHGAMRLSEIGKIIGITQERVRQIISAAVKKARATKAAVEEKEEEERRLEMTVANSNSKHCLGAESKDSESEDAIRSRLTEGLDFTLYIYTCKANLMEELTLFEARLNHATNPYVYSAFVILCTTLGIIPNDHLEDCQWWCVPRLLADDPPRVLCFTPTNYTLQKKDKSVYDNNLVYLITQAPDLLQGQTSRFMTITLQYTGAD